MKLTLKERRQETADATTYIFTPDVPVSYHPGQHISMLLSIDHPDERGKVRTFTLSSSPTEEGILAITTKHGVSSFKRALFDLPVGSVVDARGPSGGFFLQEPHTGPHVFLTGGIGITPFRSMVRYASDKRLSLPLILLYSASVPEDLVFRGELDHIQSTVSTIQVIYTITRPKESRQQWQGRVGRIDEAMIRQYCVSPNETLFYVAGPGTMVDGMIAILTAMDIAREQMRFERFPGYQ